MKYTSELGETIWGMFIILLGMLSILGAFQMEGWYKMGAIPGALAVVMTFYDGLKQR